MNDLDVRRIRLKIGISQKELAEKLGVHWRTVQNWEKNGGISQADYTKLCALLPCSTLDEIQGQSKSKVSTPTYSGAVVPLIPIQAQGGSLNDFTMSVMEFDCEKVLSPIKGVDYAMTVSGDSMSPDYPPGCQILIKRIDESAFIDWGKVFVLDTINGTIIKKLMPASNPDKVLCVSINKEYPSYEVSLEHVHGIYRVLMCMSIK